MIPVLAIGGWCSLGCEPIWIVDCYRLKFIFSVTFVVLFGLFCCWCGGCGGFDGDENFELPDAGYEGDIWSLPLPSATLPDLAISACTRKLSSGVIIGGPF